MSGDKALFNITSKKILEEIGGSELIPVASLNMSKSVSILNVVVKRIKGRWRKKAVYEPKATKLSRFLKDSTDINIQIIEEPLCEYDNPGDELHLRVNGGVKLLRNLNASVTFNVSNETSSSGLISSKYVDKRELLDALENRSIDINDLQLGQIREKDAKSVLCVVTKVIYLGADMRISGKRTFEALAEQAAHLKTSIGEVGVSASAGRSKLTNQNVKLCGETPFAYEICELRIEETSGETELVIEHGLSGGFYTRKRHLKMSRGFMSVPGGTSERYDINLPNESAYSYKSQIEDEISALSAEKRACIKDVLSNCISSKDDLEILCSIVAGEHEDEEETFKSSDTIKSAPATIPGTKESSTELSKTCRIPCDDKPATEVFESIVESLSVLLETYPEKIRDITKLTPESRSRLLEMYRQIPRCSWNCKTAFEGKLGDYIQALDGEEYKALENLCRPVEDDGYTWFYLYCVLLGSQPITGK